MGSIEDLASALYSDQIQKQIAAENSYYNLQQVPDAVSGLLTQAAVKNPGQFSTKDLIVGALLSGGASGLLGGFGDKYQSTLTNRYQDVLGGAMRGSTPAESSSGLSPSLFRGASNAGSIFRIKQTLANEQAQNDLANDIKKASIIEGVKAEADSKKEIMKQFLDNPQKAARGMSALAALQGKEPIATSADQSSMLSQISPQDVPADIATPMPQMPVAAPNTPATGGSDRLMQLADQYGDYDLGKKAYEGEIELAQKTKSDEMKNFMDLQKEANNTDTILGQLRGALNVAGETGGFPLEDTGRNLNLMTQYKLGSEEAGARIGARADLENLGVAAAGQIRKMFTGATSEKEFSKYLSVVPNTGQTKAANEALFTKMANAATLGKRRLEFISEGVNNGLTHQQAGEIFDQKYPLSQVLQSRKLIDPNLGASPDTTEYDSSIPAELLKGVTEVPDVALSLVDPKTYKEGFATPEKALETVGTGAAMTSGALAGAAAGSVLGPVGALAGGAVGGGLGYLGFGSAREAVNEATGAGTEKTVIPSRKEVLQAARLSGQGFGVGLAADAVGGIAKGASALKQGAKTKAINTIGAVKEDLLGVKPTDIRKALDEGKVKYFDETGAEAPISSATEYKTALEQSSNVLEKDGFFDAISNDSKANKLLFDQKMEAAGVERGNLIQEAGKSLQDIYDGLPATQKKQFPLIRDPKTGKGGFNPDFSKVYERIGQAEITDPQLVKQLTARANETIKGWNNTSRSFEKLQDYKETFGNASKWKAPSTEVAELWNQVKQDIYKAFANEQMRAYKFAMEKTNPEMVGALADANLKYHSYKNLEPMINRRAAQPAKSLKFGVFQTPQSIIERYPATKLKAAQQVAAKNSGAGGFSDFIDMTLGSELGQAAEMAAPALGAQSDESNQQEVPSYSAPNKPSLFRPSATGSLFRAPEGKKKMNNSEIDPIKAVEAQIDSDPIDSAIYQAESNRDPKAKNKVSSASGGFQLTSKTAKDLGVKDVFDLAQNYDGYKKLRAENQARFGSDPAMLYSAHYLGATVLAKVLEKKPLTKDEQAQVEYLKNKALPDFMKIYQSKIGSDYSEA